MSEQTVGVAAIGIEKYETKHLRLKELALGIVRKTIEQQQQKYCCSSLQLLGFYWNIDLPPQQYIKPIAKLFPLPQLWRTLVHDISAYLHSARRKIIDDSRKKALRLIFRQSFGSSSDLGLPLAERITGGTVSVMMHCMT